MGKSHSMEGHEYENVSALIGNVARLIRLTILGMGVVICKLIKDKAKTKYQIIIQTKR